MPAGWTEAKAPFNVGTALLLTDGSVFAQDDSSGQAWWRLRPDTAGEYINGMWTQAAPSGQPRRSFVSVVLGNGCVFLAGGGSPSAEMYDPEEDGWTSLPLWKGWRDLVDAPCCVLPDGTVLVGRPETGECALFDPRQRDWRQTVGKRNGSTRGESWALLSDGSVLSVDGVGHPATERYTADGWVGEGQIPADADLVEDVSKTMGPAILLTGGTVLALGATGRSAIFQAAGAQARGWRAGPKLAADGEKAMAATRGPACLLNNGNVLFLAAVLTDQAKTAGNSSITFEYGIDGTMKQQASQPPNAQSAAPADCRLLVLPNGQAMLSTRTPRLAYLTPEGAPNSNWRPVVMQAPTQIAPLGRYTLRGKQLNGLSQACAHGGGAAMATNYPLVRLRALAAAQTVTYCRTFDHSTMGVATGDVVHSTNLVVPGGTAAGDYVLEVVANGIASDASNVTVLARAPANDAGVGGNGTTRDIEEDKRLQEEMLWRDLNEVHLLMDFISGRSDKLLIDLGNVPVAVRTFPTLAMAGGAAPAPVEMSAQDALQCVCNIRFPPEGTPEEKGKQALLLLQVKDRLNRMAAPARGMTIAFTSMVAGTAGSSKELATARKARGRPALPAWWVDIFGEMRPAHETETHRRQVTGFAIASYPNLEWHAGLFRFCFRMLPGVAVFWLALTALTYWDVALSSQALRSSFAGITVTDKDCTPPAPTAGSAPAAIPAKLKVACDALANAKKAAVSAEDILIKDEREALFIAHWPWHPVGWTVHALGPSRDDKLLLPDLYGPCHVAGACDYGSDVSNFAVVVVSVFTDYILPMMFGVLGTLAGLIRSISGKIRESTLSPRDLQLMFSLIPLGAVAGLAVGLVVAPATSVALTGGMPLTLSAAGLAFLAGYGADAFFGMIDGVLTRVFTLSPAPPASGSK